MARCHRSLNAHDPDLSRMLVLFAMTGLAFMLLPGTLVGVLTLFRISSAHATGAADTAWTQAHGHAQLFGWLGTFILGVGSYTIPRLRLAPFSRAAAWTTYALWTAGVTMRWASGTWPWQWRVLYPLAGFLEMIAVAIFVSAVFLTKPRARDDAWRTSVLIITAAGFGFLFTTIVNAVESLIVARHGGAPVFPAGFDQYFLVLATWGFVVPFIWGFSTRWLPPLIGLKKTNNALALAAVAALFIGVATANAVILLVAAIHFAIALRIFEPAQKKAKQPLFLRIAYGWMIVSAVLALFAAHDGFAGAARHALTVGFFAAAVFTIGPRVLPAFFNVRRLWSTKVMFVSLALLNVGCATRVIAQPLAYGHLSPHAWPALGVSAGFEMTAVILFTFNMAMTLTTGSPLQAYLESQTA